MYKCGNKIIKLQKKAVDKFSEWNLFPFNQSIRLDKRMIRVLIYSSVKAADFVNAEEERAVEMFIERACFIQFRFPLTKFQLVQLNLFFEIIPEFIRVRAGNDECRMEAIRQTIRDIMDEKRQNALK